MFGAGSHSRLIATPGHQHQGNPILQRLHDRTMACVTEQQAAALKDRRVRHIGFHARIRREWVQRCWVMATAQRQDDSYRMGSQSSQGCLSEGSGFPRRRAHQCSLFTSKSAHI